ncbi:MAG: hypothetical protein SVU32_06645, partial [Candidatus Nanohaloarchaea archaeon]|nr:hypothetical protein [Candidatus Nanohaloarchaea archaeon]
MPDVFGVDVEGWVEQHRSRETYEIAREAVQNALDTGSDVRVRVDYDDRSVMVEDYDHEGVEDLSSFYELFSGEKNHDPEKRGRFGRGIKEFIGGSDETVIASTGGALRFDLDVQYEGLEGLTVEAEREEYPDAERERGTVVYGRNDDWEREDLASVETFVRDIWVPEEQEITLEARRNGELHEAVVESREPDTVYSARLRTMTMEDGVPVEERRETDVEVLRTDDTGGIYEMGIPVTEDEAFPFIFNVQQKIPVAERRNELPDMYRKRLMQFLIDADLAVLDEDDLAEEYVTRYLSTKEVWIDEDVQQAYLERRFGESIDGLVTYDDASTAIAVDKANQEGLELLERSDYSENVVELLDEHVRTVEEWYRELSDSTTIEEVEPTPEQEQVLSYLKELRERSEAEGIEFRTAVIRDDEDRETAAMYDHGSDTVYLNVLDGRWDEIDPERIGTTIHELAHGDSRGTGHNRDWYL